MTTEPRSTNNTAARRTPQDAVEVALDGELDLSTFDRVQSRVQEAERGSPQQLVLDLSALTFVDPTGVRLVLLTDERARADGRRLAVQLGTGPALRVFETLGLLDKIDVLPARPRQQPGGPQTDPMTAAVTDLRASIDLPATTHSVPAARRVVAQLLTAWSVEPLPDAAALLLSDLVTNVLRHVDTDPTLKVELLLSGPVLHVAVLDSSPTLPTPQSGAGRDPGGHGLRLLAAIADRWGSDRHDNGKRVWFELGRRGV